jgi:hypothetical protein
MPAIARSRPLQQRRDSQLPTSFDYLDGISQPVLLIEIDRQETTSLIQEHRIDTSHEWLPNIIASHQVPANNLIGHWQELPMHTIRTLYTWLLTNPRHPLMSTSRSVPALASPQTLKPPRINVLPSSKQRSKKGNLLIR